MPRTSPSEKSGIRESLEFAREGVGGEVPAPGDGRRIRTRAGRLSRVVTLAAVVLRILVSAYIVPIVVTIIAVPTRVFTLMGTPMLPWVAALWIAQAVGWCWLFYVRA